MDSDSLLQNKPSALLLPIVRQAEMLARQYDFVVGNPPYMGSKGMNPTLKEFAVENFPDVKSDLFAMFIQRSSEFAKSRGRLGFMSPFVWMFISSYEKLRELVIATKTITSLVQLEYSGFDGATVPICTYTFENDHIAGYKGGYVRLSDFKGSENQGPKTLEAVKNPDCGWFYRASADDFKKIPGGPIAYWLSDGMRNIFLKNDLFSVYFFSDGLTKTGDNDKYLRHHWELSVNMFRDPNKYRTCVKGGDARSFYGNTNIAVDWSPTARSHYREDNVARITPEYLWQASGISWTKISSRGPTFRWFGNGMIAETGGPAIFLQTNEREDILWQGLAFLASKVSWCLLTSLNPTLNFQTNDVLSLPFNVKDSTDSIANVKFLTELSKTDWDSYETSWDFSENPLVHMAKGR